MTTPISDTSGTTDSTEFMCKPLFLQVRHEPPADPSSTLPPLTLASRSRTPCSASIAQSSSRTLCSSKSSLKYLRETASSIGARCREGARLEGAKIAHSNWMGSARRIWFCFCAQCSRSTFTILFELHLRGAMGLTFRLRYLFESPDVSCRDWIPVVRLLTTWQFKRNRENLLKRLLLAAKPATKIVMWQEFSDLPAQEWLIQPINALLRRPTAITDEEGRHLQTDNLLRIMRISEQYSCQCLGDEANPDVRYPRRASYCASSRHCPSRIHYNFDSLIRKHYNLDDDGSRQIPNPPAPDVVVDASNGNSA